MKTSNIEPSGQRSAAATRGSRSTNLAGAKGMVWRDPSTESVGQIRDMTVIGATLTDNEDGTGILTIGAGAVLIPEATVTSTKASGNPTFNFNAIVENMIKIGSTYYCCYAPGSHATVRLASASNRDGPWTDVGQLYAVADVAWAPAGVNAVYGPHLVVDGATIYMFYSICKSSDSTLGYIGYATATTVTGPYTDHGAAILSPGGAGTWDERRVGEPAVVLQGGTWYMAYMGESMTGITSESEKLGTASAPLPSGPWTKAAGNPVAWGAVGEWDSVLMADPDLIYANGYYWMWYVGMSDLSPTSDSYEGFLYATDPTGTWTRHPSNPILLTGAGGEWDDKRVFRGGIYIEDGQWGGTYSGTTDITTLALYKGGNFRLDIDSGAVSLPPVAADITIDDAGGYYAGTDVEAALAELAADIAAIDSGEGGHWEVVVSGSSPPVAVETPDGLDWVHGFVPD